MGEGHCWEEVGGAGVGFHGAGASNRPTAVRSVWGWSVRCSDFPLRAARPLRRALR